MDSYNDRLPHSLAALGSFKARDCPDLLSKHRYNSNCDCSLVWLDNIIFPRNTFFFNMPPVCTPASTCTFCVKKKKTAMISLTARNHDVMSLDLDDLFPRHVWPTNLGPGSNNKLFFLWGKKWNLLSPAWSVHVASSLEKDEQTYSTLLRASFTFSFLYFI